MGEEFWRDRHGGYQPGRSEATDPTAGRGCGPRHRAPGRTWLDVDLARLQGAAGGPGVLGGGLGTVSVDQLRRHNDTLSEVRALGAELVGVSVDSVWCHRAFARDLRLEFRLLSDFHPRGGAARAYGVYRPWHGTSERALFVVDAAGLIRWHYLAPLEVNPGVDGMLTALEGLTHGKAST